MNDWLLLSLLRVSDFRHYDVMLICWSWYNWGYHSQIVRAIGLKDVHAGNSISNSLYRKSFFLVLFAIFVLPYMNMTNALIVCMFLNLWFIVFLSCSLLPSTLTSSQLFSSICTICSIFSTWHVRDDMFAEDSIDLLKASGIDFSKFETLGIDVQHFGELMMMSGLGKTTSAQQSHLHSYIHGK